jgi:hypothetical protein
MKPPVTSSPDHRESCFDHPVHQRIVLRQVDARFGKEVEGVAAFSLPGGDDGQQAHRLAPVADKVVVDQEHRASPAKLVQAVELAEHLSVGLGTRGAAEEMGDVAELAVERAAPRELERHGTVGLKIDEIETWCRSDCDLRP